MAWPSGRSGRATASSHFLESRRVVFGLTLTKLLLTVLVIVAVWRGFTMISKLPRTRRARVVGRRSARSDRPAGTIELVECSRCGAYFDPGEGCRCASPVREQARGRRP
jgi:hypothetical protein